MRIHGRVLAAFVGLAFGFSSIAHAEWRKAESPHFVVYSDASEADLRSAIEELEEFDAVLRALSGVEEDNDSPKLLGYMVSKSQVRGFSPGISEGVLGFYSSSPEVTAFIASNEEVEEEFSPTGSRIPIKIKYLAAKSILQHEYTHHFMLQHFPSKYPKWYVEGFAEYYSTTSITDSGIEIGSFQLGRVGSLRDGRWTPMRQIMGSLSGKYDSGFVADLYAQGWLAVSYFNSTPERRKALSQILAATRAGEKNLDKIMLDSTGMTFEEFDIELRKYMNGKVLTRTYEGWKYQAPPIQISSLPAAQSKALVLDTRLKLARGMSQAQKDRTLAEVRKLRVANPRVDVMDLLAARAEVYFGDAAAGRSLAQAVAAAQPQNAEAHYLIGLSLMEEGRKDENARAQKFKEARPALGRAFKYDPNHVGALYQTGLSLMANGDMNENTANIFMLAHQLAPQVGEISIDAAQAMLSLGKKQEAIALLQPVANDPHGGKLSERAQALLDGVVGGVPTENPALAALAPG